MKKVLKSDIKHINLKLLEVDSTNNISGRVYPRKVIERAINKFKEDKKNGKEIFCLFGRDPCGKLDKLEINGKNLMCDIAILPEPRSGSSYAINMVNYFVETNIKFKPILKGSGSIEKNKEGHYQVTNDFSVVCIGLEVDPEQLEEIY